MGLGNMVFGAGLELTRADRCLFGTCHNLAVEIGFDDFEPSLPDLIMYPAVHSGGVFRGNLEREATLSVVP